jgi:hypothetical protein
MKKIVLFLVSFIFTCIGNAQTPNDSIRYKQFLANADDCFLKKDSVCARQNWKEALKLRPWSCEARNGLMMLSGSMLCVCNERLWEYQYWFAEGKKQFKAHEYEKARTAFVVAHKISPNTTVKTRIHRCDRKLR